MMPSFVQHRIGRGAGFLLALAFSAALVPMIAWGIAWGYAHLVFAGIIGLGVIILTAINPLIGIYLLTFFLPFERIGSVDVAGITIRISQVVAIATVAAWITRGLLLRRFKLRSYPIFVPLCLFLIINFLGLTNSPNINRSLLVLIFTVFTISLSAAVPNIVRHRSQVENVVTILLVSAAAVSLFGLFQFLGDFVGLPTSFTGLRAQYTKDILGFPRIQATALEPLYFANYLLLPLSLSLALWLSRGSKIKWYLLLIVLALTTLNLILTVSRGGYIAFAVIALLIGAVYMRSLLRPRTLIGGAVVCVLVGLLVVRFFNIEEQWSTFSTHVVNVFGGASYEERLSTFTIARTIWWQHPWIGIGPGGFGPYASFHPFIVPSEGFKIVNNEYIELLAETGVLGFTSFALMVVMLIVRSFKAWVQSRDDIYMRAVVVALTAAFLGILIQYNTFSVLYITHIWFTIGLLITVQNIILHGDRQET